MAEAAARPFTAEEFLAWEAEQSDRWEYVGGCATMMVGGTLDHHLLATNLSGELRNGLKGSRCYVFGEGPKVIANSDVMYPDVVVTCGPIDHKGPVLPDPILIAEVLSPSTANRDRNAKWLAYQRLAGLRHYLLLSQDEVLVEMFTRDGESWQPLRAAGPDAVLDLPALELSLRLSDVCAGTSLAPD